MSLVTSAEAKLFLGLENTTDDDGLIAALILGVSAAIESYCQVVFSAAAITDVVDGGGECLILSAAATTITSITDSDDNVFTLTDTDQDLDAGLIYIVDGSDWYGGRRTWTVVYTGAHSSVPGDVKVAALTWIADIHANRSGVKSESLGDHQSMYAGVINAIGMPDRVKALLAPYRRFAV